MKTQTLTAKFIVVSTLLGLASGATASSSTPSHCGPNTIPDPNRPAICIVDPVFIKKVKAEAAAAVDTQGKYDEAFADGVASVDITQECTEIGVAFFQDTDASDATFDDCYAEKDYDVEWDYMACAMRKTGERLFGAYVEDAYWEGADLVGVDLSNADLSGANLTGSQLQGSDLDDVIWTGAICPDGENADDNGGTCENNL